MKIQQLSLFLENKPGQLIEPFRVLADAGVNVRSATLADTEQFGIVRLIVSEPDRAREILEGAGHVVKLTEVVAIMVPDRPGGLADVLGVFEGTNVNIVYMYGFAGKTDSAVIIFRFDDPDTAIDLLTHAGIGVLESVEVYNGGE